MGEKPRNLEKKVVRKAKKCLSIRALGCEWLKTEIVNLPF